MRVVVPSELSRETHAAPTQNPRKTHAAPSKGASRMTPSGSELKTLVREVARATLTSTNGAAWREIDAALFKAGLLGRPASIIREIVWAERRELLKSLTRRNA